MKNHSPDIINPVSNVIFILHLQPLNCFLLKEVMGILSIFRRVRELVKSD